MHDASRRPKPFALNYQLKYLLEARRLSRHSAGILFFFLLLSTRLSCVSRFQLKPELFKRKLRKNEALNRNSYEKIKKPKIYDDNSISGVLIPRSKQVRMSFVAAACAWLNISFFFLELKKSKTPNHNWQSCFFVPCYDRSIENARGSAQQPDMLAVSRCLT